MTDMSTTPEWREAVEAGAESLFESMQELGDEDEWDELPLDWRDGWRQTFADALTAAAPLLEAMYRRQLAGDAWDEGWRACGAFHELPNGGDWGNNPYHPYTPWLGQARAADIVEGKTP